jgi:hypothetical protein
MAKCCFWIATSPESVTFCTPRTPARDTVNIWLALHLLVHDRASEISGLHHADNTIVIFERSDRVCQMTQIDLWVSGSQTRP